MYRSSNHNIYYTELTTESKQKKPRGFPQGFNPPDADKYQEQLAKEN